MCAPKAPAPPDPKETSAAQTGTNVSTAIANAMMGNVNQVTPNGDLTYSQTGSYSYKDPYTGESYTVPQFTATQTLTPEQQAINQTNLGTQQNLADIGKEQSGFLKDYLGNPVDLSTENVNRYINDHFSDDFNRQWGQDQQKLQTQLAQQGILPGSEAYSNAMQDFSTQKSNAYDNMYGNEYQNAVKNIMTARQEPLNEITALMSGSQVAQPNYVSTNEPTIPTTNNAGLIEQNYQQKLANWQQQQQSNAGLLGGLFGLGKAALLSPTLFA